jgi:hypothetical protein
MPYFSLFTSKVLYIRAVDPDLLQSGSGSSILAQSVSGSTKSLNPDPDQHQTIFLKCGSGSTSHNFLKIQIIKSQNILIFLVFLNSPFIKMKKCTKMFNFSYIFFTLYQGPGFGFNDFVAPVPDPVPQPCIL